MATHSMQRAMARLEADGSDHVKAKTLGLPPVHQAMGDTLEELLGKALAVRDAPPVLRTFARTTKHMIPAMLEGMASVPESEVVDILRYMRDRLQVVLEAYEAEHPDSLESSTRGGTEVSREGG